MELSPHLQRTAPGGIDVGVRAWRTRAAVCTAPCDPHLTSTVPGVTARFHDFAIIRGVSGLAAPPATAIGNVMLSIRKLIVAAAVATVAAVTLAGPASAAGICDQQQGRRIKIDNVWHKVVHNKRGGLVDCGPAF